MNRAVLIVTPYFAPQSHAAVFRAYKLAKYLPSLGWKPYVVTTDWNYLYNEDPHLLSDLPPEVEVFRARYVEPSVRGLRMLLGGRDRTFKAVKAEARAQTVTSPAAQRSSFAQIAYKYLLDRWLHTPDEYWTWKRPAMTMARRLMREKQIPLVFTSANPYTCHQIGRELQREGARWVADLRDPHAYNARTSSPYFPVYARQLAIERAAVRSADAVTVAAQAIALICTDLHDCRSPERFHFIPTGLDDALRPECSEPLRPYPYLIFSGEYLREYGVEFLRTFKAANEHPDVSALGYRLLLVGRMEVNGHLRAAVDELGLQDCIEFVDHMPQKDLYSLIAGAKAGVVLSAPLHQWWCLYAKMVDFIALRKPVIALVPDPSEARTRLTKAGLGVFLEANHEAAVSTLVDFLSGRKTPGQPNAEECDLYLASSQVRSFAAVFENLLSGA
jgi:glycosyltransferase involved in cell wall biosynthesis